jgi:hypothetical protein
MRTTTCVYAVLLLLAVAAGSAGKGFGQDELKTMKAILATTVKQLEPKVKDDARAASELRKLREAGSRQVERMARDLKTTFKIDSLDDENVKKVEAAIKKAIDNTDASDLKKLLIDRDGKIVLQMCWLVGCP